MKTFLRALVFGFIFTYAIPYAYTQEYVVTVLGDSLSAGHNIDLEDAYPAQLEQALLAEGYDARVINAGISGDTTAGGAARIDDLLYDNPDLVIVALGGNDGLRHINVDTVESNLRRIIETIRYHGVAILLVGIKAPPGDFGYKSSFEAIYPRLADEYDIHYVDDFLEDVFTNPALKIDTLHPNAAGVAVMVNNTIDDVIYALDPTAGPWWWPF